MSSIFGIQVPADALACIESAFLLDAQDALNCYCQALEIYTRAVGYQAEPSGFEQMTLVLMARCCLELVMYVCMYACVRACVCVCVYVCMYVYMYVCIGVGFAR